MRMKAHTHAQNECELCAYARRKTIREILSNQKKITAFQYKRADSSVEVAVDRDGQMEEHISSLAF
jgi:hypothetical protein